MSATRPDLVVNLKERSTQPSGSSRRFGLRNILVVSQVALSVVALVAAGLFVRSLGNAQRIAPGFDVERLAMINFDLGAQGYERAKADEFVRSAIERAEGVPGVEGAVVSTSVPLFGAGIMRSVFLEGQDASDRRNGRLVRLNAVGLGYFSTFGVPLLRGRDFTTGDAENTPQVVVVSEAMAKQFWPGEDPIGKRFKFFGQPDYTEVVGVARDVKVLFLGEEPTPLAYQPIKQAWSGALAMVVRSRGNPSAVLGTVRQQVQQMDRNLPINFAMTMGDVLDNSLWAPRMGAMLLAIFAALSLLLASVGLYGLLAYNVSQRTQEMGVRMALGASRADVLGLVVRNAMILTALGIVIGVAAAWLVAGLVENLLYGVGGRDMATFVAIPLILALVALVASYLPARQATLVEPSVALRYE